jgi:hypothetical protein
MRQDKQGMKPCVCSNPLLELGSRPARKKRDPAGAGSESHPLESRVRHPTPECCFFVVSGVARITQKVARAFRRRLQVAGGARCPRPVLSPAHYQDAQRAETKLASTVGIKPARHQH